MTYIYYELSSNQNNSKALYQLGNLYLNGEGVSKNYSLAKHYYTLSANQNNSNALNKLGDIHFYGLGVEKNYYLARHYYELSASKNNKYALNNLGDIYFYGFGVIIDYSKAIHYYELAIKYNNTRVLSKMGNIYVEGIGVKKDLTKSVHYIELSASKLDFEGIIMLDYLCHLENDCAKKSLTKFLKYFDESFQQKNSINNDISDKKLQDILDGKSLYDLLRKFRILYPLLLCLMSFFLFFGIDIGPILHEFIISYYFLFIGIIYEKGYGCKRDVQKAKEYYEIAMSHHNADVFIQIANMYKNGYAVTNDYSKAKLFYLKAYSTGNTNALVNLGNLYYYGLGSDKIYFMAYYYYWLTAQRNNHIALFNLGLIYFEGKIVPKDYSFAKRFFELSGRKKNSDALFYLGIIFENGYGVKKDYLMAKDYYEFSAKEKNMDALYYLANLFSEGDLLDTDIPRALKYLLKCIEINNEKDFLTDQIDDTLSLASGQRGYNYRSSNDIGLIYFFEYQDIEKAKLYLQNAAFAEFPYGQNNYGLLFQFYLNDNSYAKYMFGRSSTKKFALAEYNIGYLKEKAGEVEESITHYKNASAYEDEPLYFHNHHHFDRRLDISKTFIICLTNLKLFDYYFSQGNFVDSKKYFIKAFSKLEIKENNSSYSFQFRFTNENNPFSYLKNYILSFPSFNLINQPNVSILNNSILNDTVDSNEKSFQLRKKFSKILGINNISIDRYDEEFDDPGKLHDFVIVNHRFIIYFAKEIKDIINTMHHILYIPPYSILFGRINLEKKKEKEKETPKLNSTAKTITQSFYDGFGF